MELAQKINIDLVVAELRGHGGLAARTSRSRGQGRRDRLLLGGFLAYLAAATGKIGATFRLYLGAEHGFICTDRASYNQHAAALAHGR
jgi:dienelactone hydrolase